MRFVGAVGSDNAGMSSVKHVEITCRRKSKVSSAT